MTAESQPNKNNPPQSALHGLEEFKVESPPNFGSFCIRLPRSDLRQEWIMENSLFDEFNHTFTMARLEGIDSLSLLAYSGTSPASEYLGLGKQSREFHSYLVGYLVGEIMQNNDFPEDQIAPASIAGLLHDSGMAAHGDAVMKIDFDNLSEETNYHDALDENVLKLLKKYNVTLESLDEIIQNKGLAGKILDIADRITYVMFDLETLAAGPANFEEMKDWMDEIDTLAHDNPMLGNIYKDVRVDKDLNEPYFEDSSRLGIFLKVRALLHRNFYMQPISQGRDLFFGNLVKRYYSSHVDSNMPLNPVVLRQLTDYGLEVMLSDLLFKEIGEKRGPEAAQDIINTDEFRAVSPVIKTMINKFMPENQRFATQEEAEKAAKELSQDPNVFVIGVNERGRFDPGTSYLTRDKNGDITPFRFARSELSQEIEEIANALPGYFVHYANIDNSPLGKLLKFLKEES